jgi:hypothetical protein
MSNKIYNVLWFEDEFNNANLQEIADKAYDEYSIKLNGFESAEEGLKILEVESDFFDAILLDARFYLNKDDISGTEDLKGLSRIWKKLDQLEASGIIFPRFILSGQTALSKDSTFSDTYGGFYSKHEPEDINRLFNDIIIAADKRIETQIRHKYADVFDVCAEKYIGEKAAKILMDILLSMSNHAEKFDDENYFNGLRKVVEYVFRASNKLGLLHDRCIQNDEVNLTWSSLFMAGREVELKSSNNKISCSKTHFPVILANNVRSILNISNSASHTEADDNDNGKISFSEYKEQIPSNYLLYSLIYQVMDLLIWYKKYADENPFKEKNKALWLPKEESLGDWQDGLVINLNPLKGFAFFKPNNGAPNSIISPRMVTDLKLSNNESVFVIIEEYEDTKTNEIRKRVKELKK